MEKPYIGSQHQSGKTCDVMVVVVDGNRLVNVTELYTMAELIPDFCLSVALVKGGTDLEDGYIEYGIVF